MSDFFIDSVEYQGWGYNALTIGAIGALTLTLIQAWGMYKQVSKIWSDRKADVLSVHWFGYLTGFMLACIPYGIAAKSLTIVAGVSVLLIFHLLILWGIYKFRGLTLAESIGLILYALMLPAMILLPWKDAIYLAVSLGTVWAMATQSWEMFKAEENGEVEIRMLITILINVTFWSIYAFAIDALALMILNPTLFVITITTIVLWFKNNKSRVTAVD